ncbi:hypothetical protein E2986_10831 [Frieseomelitta varia]|uniref:Uncharacterized protein n=1 Tax=Frieseomelitta varia TaxID=561572 RepID=A0A833RLF0_9HYME|nr:hypothetical protein E2986_10831 [Frieseomelitta varia]
MYIYHYITYTYNDLRKQTNWPLKKIQHFHRCQEDVVVRNVRKFLLLQECRLRLCRISDCQTLSNIPFVVEVIVAIELPPCVAAKGFKQTASVLFVSHTSLAKNASRGLTQRSYLTYPYKFPALMQVQERRFRVAPFTDYAQENPIHRDNFDFYETMRDLQRRESANGYKAGNFLDAFTLGNLCASPRQPFEKGEWHLDDHTVDWIEMAQKIGGTWRCSQIKTYDMVGIFETCNNKLSGDFQKTQISSMYTGTVFPTISEIFDEICLAPPTLRIVFTSLTLVIVDKKKIKIKYVFEEYCYVYAKSHQNRLGSLKSFSITLKVGRMRTCPCDVASEHIIATL